MAEDATPRDRREGSGDEAGGFAYEPPAIAWEEQYEAVVLTFSCAFEAGNPGCGAQVAS